MSEKQKLTEKVESLEKEVQRMGEQLKKKDAEMEKIQGGKNIGSSKGEGTKIQWVMEMW